MPKTIHDKGVEHHNTDADMTYLENNNIYHAIRQNLRKTDVYETKIHKIYNIIVDQTTEQLQEKAASDSTFQAVKTGREPIGYLIILKKLYLSNQYEQNLIRSICLATIDGNYGIITLFFPWQW